MDIENKIGCFFLPNLDISMCYNIIFICRPLPTLADHFKDDI